MGEKMGLIKHSKNCTQLLKDGILKLKAKNSYLFMAFVAVATSIIPIGCKDLSSFSDNGVDVIAYGTSYGASYGWMIAIALFFISFFITNDQTKQKLRTGAICAAIGWAICLVVSDDSSVLSNTLDKLVQAITGKSGN